MLLPISGVAHYTRYTFLDSSSRSRFVLPRLSDSTVGLQPDLSRITLTSAARTVCTYYGAIFVDGAGDDGRDTTIFASTASGSQSAYLGQKGQLTRAHMRHVSSTVNMRGRALIWNGC